MQVINGNAHIWALMDRCSKQNLDRCSNRGTQISRDEHAQTYVQMQHCQKFAWPLAKGVSRTCGHHLLLIHKSILWFLLFHNLSYQVFPARAKAPLGARTGKVWGTIDAIMVASLLFRVFLCVFVDFLHNSIISPSGRAPRFARGIK